MKKSLTPIPIILMVIVSIVFASGILFPDTTSLPRYPTGSGTIGVTLSSLFDSDGTAHNTNMLSGVYASGYLHNMDCSSEPLNKVWVGIDANGRGICGNTAKLIGYLTEQAGDVQVSRDGGANYNSVPNGTGLYKWDLIQSKASGTGMIRFAADDSLLRFAPSTDLELDYGTLGGNTVAEVILNNGRLWGRILSATGVNLWGGWLVTWVRGTSVDIQKIGSTYTINTVSSASTGNVLQQVFKHSGGSSEYPVTDPSISPFSSGSLITYASGAPGYTAVKTPRLSSLSYTDAWIRGNTITDINYLSNLLIVWMGWSGPTITSAQSGQINKELDNTLVQWDTAVTQALLGNITCGTTSSAVANMLNIDTKWDNKYNAKALSCKLQCKTYFPAMPSNVWAGSCAGEWNTRWMSSNLSQSLNVYGTQGDTYSTTTWSTNEITGIGKYLQYDLTQGNLNTLTGKTIEIEFTALPTWNNWLWNGLGSVILDLGNDLRVLRSNAGDWKCAYSSSDIVTCDVQNTSPFLVTTDWNVATIKISSAPITRFIIGNGSQSSYKQPINTTIKSIKIN